MLKPVRNVAPEPAKLAKKYPMCPHAYLLASPASETTWYVPTAV